MKQLALYHPSNWHINLLLSSQSALYDTACHSPVTFHFLFYQPLPKPTHFPLLFDLILFDLIPDLS